MFEQDESMLRFGVTPVENLFIHEDESGKDRRPAT